MFICHCRAVTDRAIRAAIEAGASDPRAVGRSCGAGSRCGGCWPALEALLSEYGLGSDAAAGAHAA
ncbi:MAG TPA: (2Fe-2S)-binding protein [Acidimicrobiales bacterium]|jgi:bacterioferritin-associated ferredoxin|nr:(2Fe-2S)-binding protein [Acidimicrobiales bacterium]